MPLASFDLNASRDGRSAPRQRGTGREGSHGSVIGTTDRRSLGPALLVCQQRLALEGGVDGAGELAFEAAECFAAALALGLFALEVSLGWWMDAALGDGDSVQCAVELAVAAAVETVALVFA